MSSLNDIGLTDAEILIVESSMIQALKLQTSLEQYDYRVTVARNGMEALKYLKEHNPCIVISDIDMPKMDGLTLCRKIRSLSQDNYTYIIIITAKGNKEDLVEVFNNGADDYVPKPFDLEELKSRIDTGGRIINLEEKHKKLQNLLIESRNKVKIVFDTLHEEIVALDDQFQIVSANKAFVDGAATTFKNAIGLKYFTYVSDKKLFHSIKTIKKLLDKVFDTGLPQFFLDKSADNNGDDKYKQITLLPIKDGTGNVFQVVFVSKDITEDKKKTEKISTLNKKLMEKASQIKEKNKKLKQTLKRLEETQSQIIQSEKMASIGQLAAGVAHEINNPIGFVSSNLKTLIDYQDDLNGLIELYRGLITALDKKNKEELSFDVIDQVAKILNQEVDVDIEFVQEDIMDLIGDCREGTGRIKKIVIDLKDFAHPGGDKIQTTDINRGLESTLNVVANELKYKATIIKDFGDIPTIKAYPQQLNQVFMNILVNAAQAIEKQGEIKIKTQQVNGKIEISISDTGCGIPKKNLLKIFDPFFTTKDVGKGTGLGMNIAYSIIKKHKGTIEVDSVVGQGTTFTIRLPVN